MTFGEHLEELRRHIIIGLIAFAAAFTAAFAFQDQLMWFFTRPYERARASINVDLATDWAKSKHAEAPATRLVDELIDVLRKKPGLIPAEDDKRLLEIQSKELEEKAPQLEKMQSVATGEYFGGYMLVCLLASLIISAPILLWELWKFVAAGLYEHERKLVLRILPFSLLLFFAGFAFGYFILAELSVRFLIGYGDVTLVQAHVAIGAYLGLLFLLLFVMGLVFQIPLVMTVLSAVGLVQPAFYRGKRRYFILAIFIVAAIVTPPDYISQLIVAGPMLLLFELGVWMASGAAKRRKEAVAPTEAAAKPETAVAEGPTRTGNES